MYLKEVSYAPPVAFLWSKIQ